MESAYGFASAPATGTGGRQSRSGTRPVPVPEAERLGRGPGKCSDPDEPIGPRGAHMLIGIPPVGPAIIGSRLPAADFFLPLNMLDITPAPPAMRFSKDAPRLT